MQASAGVGGNTLTYDLPEPLISHLLTSRGPEVPDSLPPSSHTGLACKEPKPCWNRHLCIDKISCEDGPSYLLLLWGLSGAQRQGLCCQGPGRTGCRLRRLHTQQSWERGNHGNARRSPRGGPAGQQRGGQT